MTLTELFNPSFFMFLGILLLSLSFLIFYFENKIREQNHKINSMFSLVSSITEELNNANMRIHYIMNGTSQNINTHDNNIHSVSILPNTNVNTYSNKIEVSDDEEDEDEDDEDEDEDDEEDEEDEDEDEEDEDEDEEDDEEINKNQDLDIQNLEELNDLGEEVLEEDPNLNETKTFVLKNDPLYTKDENLSSDLKSIHISLDQTLPSDYKKLSVTQLKNLVIQKGLANLEEVNKMKKGDMFKLLSSTF